MCISRRALKGKKYRFRDIHNFSFSAKIQETEIFPLGTECCCTTLQVKISLNIAVSLTVLEDIFKVLFSAKIQDGR